MAEILASLNQQLSQANGPRIESGVTGATSTNPVTPGADPGSMQTQAPRPRFRGGDVLSRG